MSIHKPFAEKGYEVAHQLLFDVCDLLDQHDVTYHLEGGTLLGIVRDQKLIPWDHDLDISIIASQADKALQVLRFLPAKWRLSKRFQKESNQLWKAGDLRLIKVKSRRLYFLPGEDCLDIFVKFCDDDFAYWKVDRHIMRANKKHYLGQEKVEFMGKNLSAPADYQGYLREKYGDWQTPEQNWHFSQEKTIVPESK